MTEPGSIQSFRSVEEESALAWSEPLPQDAAKSLQLQLDLETVMIDNDPASSMPPDFAALSASPLRHPTNFYTSESQPPEPSPTEAEASFLRSQHQKQAERIRNLERALDQSLILVEELRGQLVVQQFLENQLAATEEIANIQQRAITQLKQQLAQPPHCTSDRPTSPPSTTTAPIETTPTADFSEVSPQRVADLTQQLDNYQRVIEQLETELDRTHLELQEQQTLIDSLQRVSLHQPTLHSSSLDQELFTAQCKIQDLELQVSKQVTTQAILQHTCQELEQARDRYHARASELELQTAGMQEQILKQAQQASEYETAIQHWKDRYVTSQDYLQRLKNLVEGMETRPTNELAELLAAIQVMMNVPEPESGALTPTRTTRMDIPDFLARHQRYRVRS